MQLLLVSFGKVKTPGLSETRDYYVKLLGATKKSGIDFQELELKPEVVPEKSAAIRTQIQKKEEQILLQAVAKKLGPAAKFVLLSEEGKTWTTGQWAKNLEAWKDQIPAVALCIGSSLGFSDELRKSAHAVISLGPQTMAHELAHVVLLEQTYRAWSVMVGHPYHHGGQ